MHQMPSSDSMEFDAVSQDNLPNGPQSVYSKKQLIEELVSDTSNEASARSSVRQRQNIYDDLRAYKPAESRLSNAYYINRNNT